MSKMTPEAFNRLIQAELPWAAENHITLESIDTGEAEVRLPFQPRSLRPGGTIAGPQMMMLADACMYAVVLSQIGEVKLAVTTNLNINFLRKPANSDLVARGRMIKLGKRLAVVEVAIFSDTDIVAHATGTYSIPPTD